MTYRRQLIHSYIFLSSLHIVMEKPMDRFFMNIVDKSYGLLRLATPITIKFSSTLRVMPH